MQGIKVGNSRFIKDLNQAGIFKLIHKLGPVSRKELAENTKYSAATISNHVKTLMDKDFVIETEKGHSTGGRKPVYLTVNPEKGYILSVEIEVNQVKLVLFNMMLMIVTKTSFSINNKLKPAETVEQIFCEINKMLKEEGRTAEELLGIGIAVPGLIDKERGILEFAPNLGWRDVKLVKLFRDKFDLPVVLENEANASAVGEREFVYPGAENMVYVSINEGVGCGIIIDGQLYRGVSGNAGEFGHIIIDSNGPGCHCGNQGCWETMSSENYLTERYSLLTGQKGVKKEEIYRRLIEEETTEILQITREIGNNIGLGLVNIINSLSPRLVIIGGGIIKIKDYIKEDILRVLSQKTLDISYQNVDLKFSKLDGLAVVYGLAGYVFEDCISVSGC